MINAIGIFIGDNNLLGTGGSGFIDPTPPASDIILKFNLYDLTTMWQERSIFPGGVPVTPVTTNTNPIGTIFDQSLATTFLRATGSTTIPTLTADGVTFDGSNDLLEVPGSNIYLKGLHSVGAVWAMRFWIKKGLDGAARSPINNQGSSATQNGFYLQLTAANKVRIFIGDGTAPAICDYTSTASLTVAMGATPIQIIINGANSKLVIGSTTETFTASITEGSTNNANANLRVGGDGSTYFTGSISRDLMFVNRVWTAQEMSDYQSYNPSITTNKFTPIKQWDLDFNDTTNVFSDAGETTPITDGGTIRSIRSKVTIPYNSAFRRKATSASALASPIWRASAKNGAAEFDGTGTQILTYSEDLWFEVGGVSTTMFIFKNDDATFGSHYVNGNPEYGTVTGKNYSGNAAVTGDAAQPYSTCHHGGAGGSGTGPTALVSRSDDYNILVIRRFGGVADIFNQRKNKTSLSGFGKFTSSLFGTAAPAGGTNWHPDGNLVRIIKYTGFIDDDQTEAWIDEMKTEYTISGTL